MTDDNRVAWLRHWWAPARKARGFKLQFNPGMPQFEDLARLGREFCDLRPVIFRLGRRDRVRHAVSVLRASALLPLTKQLLGEGIGHVREGDPEELHAFRERPLEIDPAAFRQMVENVDRNTHYMDAFLAGFDGVQELYYEDYLADRLSVLNTITAAIGVPHFTEAPAEVVLKISDNDLRKAVANYDEIADEARRMGLTI